MAKSHLLKILFSFIIAGTISLISYAGYVDKLFQFIDDNSGEETSVSINPDPVDISETKTEKPFGYEKGDWSSYVVSPKYELLFDEEGVAIIQDTEELNINSYGSFNFGMLYGKSKFTNNKYKRSDDDKPVSRLINDGFNLQRELQLHIEGNMGNRVTLYIDHDSEKRDNRYKMKYKALKDDEVVREVNAGEIDIKFQHSKYAVYDDNTAKGLGMDFTLKKNDFQIKAFGSVTRGETEIEYYKGNSTSNYVKLAEYQYQKNTYFQLEPFKRYDNLTTAPAVSSYSSLITFTSEPLTPKTYTPYSVNISPGNFELYMDDQNPYNNLNSIKLGIDGGYYDKMVSSVDYTINYSTGLITIKKTIPQNARIYAVYTLDGSGSKSSDPSARTDVGDYSGRIFVFIKYGYSINEDINKNFIQDSNENDNNGDGKFNLDIYEVRSFYRVGDKQLLQENFKLQFYRENSVLTESEANTLGKYNIDYTEGLIYFNLREPFRNLLSVSGNADPDLFYSENQSSNIFTYSKYNLRADYYKEARSFQLKHTNIIEDSVRIRINGRELAASLYSVDYTAGYLRFTDPNNPVINSETEIEIKYEYLPFASQRASLVTGVRTDYKINKNLNVGSTILFTRDAAAPVIPDINNEPSQTLVLEADTSLHLGEKTLKDIANGITGLKIKSIPVELSGYAEYAKSYKKVNTFGKALIDDMESNEDIATISLHEKDWQLSSMPYNSALGDILQSDRGILNYYYYRNPSDPDELKGTDFGATRINYSQKPGPFNVATGHIEESIQEQRNQISLAMDFDFTDGNHVSAVTRRLSEQALDFSNLQYMEIWYSSAGGTGQVELYTDIGALNEDSDSDNRLDTEDANNNGVLDYDPAAGRSEDLGYKFDPSGEQSTLIGTGPNLNSYTKGDGILNTEDLNANGILDKTESRVRLPSADATDISTITINMADTSWKKARVYLDKSKTSSYGELLKQISSVRLFLRNQTATRGRIYIDTIKFVSTIWGNLEVNGSTAFIPQDFSITAVDTINDSEYRQNAFMYQERDLYKSLYGEKNDSELASQKETALEIKYNTDNCSAVKHFTKPVDIRAYKTLNAWFNFREFTAGDSITFLIGSSDTDYIEYQFDMDYAQVWRQMQFKLKDGSGGSIEKSGGSGEPDLKRISYIKIIITGTSGRFWLDDIYVSDPEAQTDSAYWYEGELKFKRPLFYTDSKMPVFSNMDIKYIAKGHGSQFSTVGKPDNDLMEQYRELFSSVNILPAWKTSFDLISEKSETDSLNESVIDSKRGKTHKTTILAESDYVSASGIMPSIKIIYKRDDLLNSREEQISSNDEGQISNIDVVRNSKDLTQTPSIILNHRLSDVFGCSINSSVALNMLFRDQRIERESADISLPELSQKTSINELEKRQKDSISGNIDLRNKYFFAAPALSIGSHEIVGIEGKTTLNDTQINRDLDSGYHVPLYYNKDLKFVEREKKTSLKFGALNRLFSPDCEIALSYAENRFRDYDTKEIPSDAVFTREKDARSILSSKIQLPVLFEKTKSFKFIKLSTVNFSRSVYYEEKNVPYEGEAKSAMQEEYGFARAYSSFSGPALDYWTYPPWYFFQGRENFSHGRDYAYEKNNNRPNEESGYIDEYTNNLKLIDNATINALFDIDLLSVNISNGINQVSERQMIYGIPQQVVTYTSSVSFAFDLMRIFHFGFFRQNKAGEPYRAANMTLGYEYSRNMLITSNIQEDSHSPQSGITFKRGRTSLGFKTGFNYRLRHKREYISLDDNERDENDDIYIINMSNLKPFKENDKSYNFSALYETEVNWVYEAFSRLYKLIALPIFSLEYSLLLNRYDYTATASPEPYDQHLVTGKLTLDLHKNIQGGITGRWALEKFRNRDTDHVNREITSYELGVNFSLVF